MEAAERFDPEPRRPLRGVRRVPHPRRDARRPALARHALARHAPPLERAARRHPPPRGAAGPHARSRGDRQAPRASASTSSTRASRSSPARRWSASTTPAPTCWSARATSRPTTRSRSPRAARCWTAWCRGIGDLPEKMQQVLSLYYCDNLNLKEIGSVLGVTESRVCQIHGEATRRLRDYAGRAGRRGRRLSRAAIAGVFRAAWGSPHGVAHFR